MKSLVVLPTYQEAGNIRKILEALREKSPESNILVVDDSSPDGTADIAREAAKDLGNIEVLVRPEKAGLGRAYIEGFKWGLNRGYEAFVEMDSDFSHDPADVPRLLEKIEEGYDLVVGSRYVPGGAILNWTALRKLISYGGNLYARIMLRIPVKDSTAGFRAYSGRILSLIALDEVRSSGYGFQVEMTYRAIAAGGRVTEIPITFKDREVGSSKMNSKIVVEAFGLVTGWGIKVWTGRSPLKERSTGRERALQGS